MQYQRRHDGTIIRTRTDVADGLDEVAGIPPDEANTDYQTFLAHVEAGGDVEDLPEPPTDPTVDRRAAVVTKARGYLGAVAPTAADREAQLRRLTRLTLGDLEDVT